MALAEQPMPRFLVSLLQACQPEVVKLPFSMMVLLVSMIVRPASMMVLSADCETVRMQENGLTIHAGGDLLVKLVHHARALQEAILATCTMC